MRLINRTDTPLAAGLIAASFVLFRQPLRFILDATREIEGNYHLDLVPALVVLGAAFMFHQCRKRRQAHEEMLAAAAEGRQHLERAQELEALMVFGRMLASALDVPGLRHAVSRGLPTFSGEQGMWILVTRQGGWDVLAIDPVTEQELSADDLERVATAALASSADEQNVRGEGVVIDATVCFPLLVGTTAIGVLGVRQTGAELSGRARRALGVAASLLSIAVRNVHMLIETKELSIQDSLTGCLNRKPGLEALGTELRRTRRTGQPLSVLMLDVDKFKQINDRHGHLCGDLVLATIGQHLIQVLRASDLKCRYGGDEFILILPDTSPEGAEHVADAIGKALATQGIAYNGRKLDVTVSIGIALAEAGEVEPAAIISRADRALYDAKQSGRNRWVCASSHQSPVASGATPIVPARDVAPQEPVYPSARPAWVPPNCAWAGGQRSPQPLVAMGCSSPPV